MADPLPGVSASSGGCRKKEEVHPTAGEDGVYQIYYLNSTRTGLASVSYQTETTDAEILIGELAGQILRRRKTRSIRQF